MMTYRGARSVSKKEEKEIGTSQSWKDHKNKNAVRQSEGVTRWVELEEERI